MNSSKTRKTQEKYIVKFKFAMKSHFSLTVLTFYFFSYLLICLHWQSYPTIFKGKDFYKNSQILQIQMAIHFLIFRVGNLVHIIKWPIKASFSVHVLTIFAFHHHMNFSNIISVNLGLNKIDHYFRNGRFVHRGPAAAWAAWA